MRVVLVHGFGCDARLMRPQAQFLREAGHDVTAPELPFHGGPTDGVEMSLMGLAEWLAREHLHAPTLLIGHSLGGMIALHLALERPHLVTGVALLDSFPSLELNRDVLPGMFVEGSHDVVRKWIEATRSEILEHMTPAVYDTIWPNVVAFDARSRLSEIGCPLLGVYGGRDLYHPADAHQLLPRLSLHTVAGPTDVSIIPGCGHFAHLERPDDVNAALRDWLALRF